jgi:glutaredoxin-like protein
VDAHGNAEGNADRDGGGEVVVYWRRGCPYCVDLELRMRFSRLRYRRVNIHQDPRAAAFVRSVAGGNETVPTVVVAGHAMVNPSKRQVMAAVTRYAPRLLDRGRRTDG